MFGFVSHTWLDTVLTPGTQQAAGGLPGNAFQAVVALGTDPSMYSPSAGDWYAVDAGAIGAWAGKDGQLACYTSSGWTFWPVDGTIIYPENVGSAYYYGTGAAWAPWLPSGTVPTGYFSLNGSAGTSNIPAPLDHGHKNYAQANGDTFGDTTNRWNMRVGGLNVKVVKVTSGGTLNLDLMANGDTTTVIWCLATAGNNTINLPAASEMRLVWCSITCPGANTVTFHPAGTDTINGAAADKVFAVASSGKGAALTCDAAGAWSLVGGTV